MQNRWLRVETRQDDGSISPVALDDAFRPTERALAFVQPLGAARAGLERCDYGVQPYEDELGRGRVLALTSRLPRRSLLLRREVVMYDTSPSCVTRLEVTNEGGAPVAFDTLVPFATDEGRARLRLASKPSSWRFYHHGWQSWAPTLSLGGTDRALRSAPPVLAPEAPPAEAGSFASEDVGVLYDAASGHSLLAGAVTARDFLTRVALDAPARDLGVACLCDGIQLHPGETLRSECVSIDVAGGPNEQLARYGDALGRLMHARLPEHTPSGWCSWYEFYTQVTEDDVIRNLRFLERHRRELPIETVQIDDGYQAGIGDWLETNEKFPRGMHWLASEISRAGYTPGIWLAPFLLAESSKTYAAHPEWVVPARDGGPAVAMHNWQRRNFALDGSHPAAQAWLRDLFREVCDGWGYDYVKVDFLFAAAIAGVRYDPATTRVRAYRAALDAVREGVGDRRFILGCGALIAPSVGVFDGNRIGPDVAPFWRNLTHEERAAPKPRARRPDDALSAEVAIRNTMTRWWTHGRLWANDPDCLLVRTHRTKLTLDETRTLASVIGLSGGMVLSSDDLERVPPERIEIISILLPPLARGAVPPGLLERDMPERVELAREGPGPARVIAVFNFGDEAHELSAPLPDGRWHAVSLWDERYLGVVERELRLPFVEPHACRVVALAPAGPEPGVIASTAHIGMATDIAASAYDRAERMLVLRVEPVGRSRRRLFVATAGLAVDRVLASGHRCDVAVGGDAAWFDITVERTLDVTVTFSSR